MARGLNKVVLIGNVGTEPEIRTTGGGTKVAKVSLATGRVFKDRSGQQQEKTEWHRLTFWDRLADLVEQYVHKGDRLYVEGRIEYSQTEDQQGQQRYWTDIVVSEMVMLGSTDSQPSRQQSRPAQPTRSPFEADDDDLGF
jgi:single-strand DNA-binding protein